MKKNHKRIRGGSGLGDAVYLRPVAEHFVRQGFDVYVLSIHEDVFIGSGAKAMMFEKQLAHVVAHYAHARTVLTTTQYQDMLQSAQLPKDLPLKFDWPVRNTALIEHLKKRAAGRKIVVVHGGRHPFGRSDGLGMEILPERSGFDSVLGHLNGRHFKVRVGKGSTFYNLPSDMDLHDKTTVSDVLDVIASCDGVITQCGFPIPMAEVFGKPVLGVWSARGLASKQAIVPTVTPKKILTALTSTFIVDNWDSDSIREVTGAFCQLV